MSRSLLLSVVTTLLFLTGCGPGDAVSGSDSSASDTETDTRQDAGSDAQSCDGWEEELGPIPEDYWESLGDDELGYYLKLSMLSRWRTGPEAHRLFVCALEKIREWPEGSATRLYEAYQQHPHERRQDRWDLTDHLALLVVEPATGYLISIALEPVLETHADGPDARRLEIAIRSAAMIGLEAMIYENVDAESAWQGLIRVVLEHEDDSIKQRAAGKLKGMGMTKEEFAEIVEGTDSEWLLESY
jgi:hypothetical protein